VEQSVIKPSSQLAMKSILKKLLYVELIKGEKSLERYLMALRMALDTSEHKLPLSKNYKYCHET
jgi:hypothetical protein